MTHKVRDRIEDVDGAARISLSTCGWWFRVWEANVRCTNNQLRLLLHLNSPILFRILCKLLLHYRRQCYSSYGQAPLHSSSNQSAIPGYTRSRISQSFVGGRSCSQYSYGIASHQGQRLWSSGYAIALVKVSAHPGCRRREAELPDVPPDVHDGLEEATRYPARKPVFSH